MADPLLSDRYLANFYPPLHAVNGSGHSEHKVPATIPLTDLHNARPESKCLESPARAERLVDNLLSFYVIRPYWSKHVQE